MSDSQKRVLTGTHFMLGNHAVVEGALAAGCNFFAGYPITPANEISQQMGLRMPSVGGTFLQGEDDAARFIKHQMNKPVVALIVGRTAPMGAQMGHAGAIIEGDGGTAESKINALKAAGAYVAKSAREIPEIIGRMGV
jgi:hypothetical protein